VFQGIGSIDMSVGARIIAHGVAGGTMSALQGGKFGHGFASAGVTQAFAPEIGRIGGGAKSAAPARILATVIVGGTSTVLSGGKFANGAVTAAFSYAFNELAHRGGGGGGGGGGEGGYSPDKPWYHRYGGEGEGDWAICRSSQDWCSQARAFETLTHWAYPGQDNSQPVWNGVVSEVFFAGSTAGHIQTFVDPGTFSIRNQTLPDHIFHDGYVQRSVVWKGDTLNLRTFGEGNNKNFYRLVQNVGLWRPGFNQYNHQFQQSMIQSWLREQQ